MPKEAELHRPETGGGQLREFSFFYILRDLG